MLNTRIIVVTRSSIAAYALALSVGIGEENLP